MSKAIKWLLAAAGLMALLLWPLTRPLTVSGVDLPDHRPDPVNGEQVFIAGGCDSCHGENLAGGLELRSGFGTFLVPNISPDLATGIGGWTALDLVNSMMLGTSPEGRHYYPAFPYTSYTRMKVQDIIDLKAYIDTREPANNRVGPHQIAFPWSLRRGIGLWKLMYLDQAPVVAPASADPAWERGRYLVEAVGHCGECHTARNPLGGMKLSMWLAGGPDPEGEGRVPNITPHPDGLQAWSAADIVYYLESGFTPDFDTVGGSMVKVQEHIALLPASDRQAIALYLKSVPARP
ncbi:MAG: c-type cytochrome [Xanthomonadales bacterium]|nr:cytochrome c [Gammaproteobacteria bacterium]MBT8054003.1 cytochrome c [Gammaproteobacteria bacterium]NND56987.1 c-type cytochrome [Xanthomonadales bacterium]NNK51945.1 c-type cytochrome [Xanthomonadales bacterium]